MWKFGGLRGQGLLGGSRLQSYVAAAAREQRVLRRARPARNSWQVQAAVSSAEDAIRQGDTGTSRSSADLEEKQTGQQQRQRRSRTPAALATQELSAEQQPQHQQRRKRRRKRTQGAAPADDVQQKRGDSKPQNQGDASLQGKGTTSHTTEGRTRQRQQQQQRQSQQRQPQPQQQSPRCRPGVMQVSARQQSESGDTGGSTAPVGHQAAAQREPVQTAVSNQANMQKADRGPAEGSPTLHSRRNSPDSRQTASADRGSQRSEGPALLDGRGSRSSPGVHVLSKGSTSSAAAGGESSSTGPPGARSKSTAKSAAKQRPSGLEILLGQQTTPPIDAARSTYGSAAEVLCAVGMSPAEAANCLRRASDAPGPAASDRRSSSHGNTCDRISSDSSDDDGSIGGSSSAVVNHAGPDSTDGTGSSSAEHGNDVASGDSNSGWAGRSITAGRAEHVCQWLVQGGVPVLSLAAVLQQHPSMLCADPARDWLPQIRLLRDQGLEVAAIEWLIRKQPDWLLTAAVQESSAVAAAGQLGPELRFLEDLVGSGGLLAPQGMPVLQAKQRFLAFAAVMLDYGLNTEQARAIVTAAPRLLAKNPEECRQAMDFLTVSGFQGKDLASMLERSPNLLGKNATEMQRKLHFLMQNRPKPGDEVLREVAEYPRFFQHSLASCIGPRLAFLRARQQQEKLKLALATLFSRSDYEFAENICKVLVEEYVVYKAQWERTYGMQFGGKLSNVRSVVQPKRPVGAEGRFAIV